jgi:hypothetical protein
MTRSVTVYRKRRLPKEEARAERRILRVLTIVTAPAPTLEKLPLDPAARSTAERVRDAFATPNVVGVGMSEKVTKGKGTGMLALTFYVERKVPLRRLSGLEALPPALPFGAGAPEAVPIDVVESGRLQLEAGPNAKHNPIQPGFSIGHVNVTAGQEVNEPWEQVQRAQAEDRRLRGDRLLRGGSQGTTTRDTGGPER